MLFRHSSLRVFAGLIFLAATASEASAEDAILAIGSLTGQDAVVSCFRAQGFADARDIHALYEADVEKTAPFKKTRNFFSGKESISVTTDQGEVSAEDFTAAALREAKEKTRRKWDNDIRVRGRRLVPKTEKSTLPFVEHDPVQVVPSCNDDVLAKTDGDLYRVRVHRRCEWFLRMSEKEYGDARCGAIRNCLGAMSDAGSRESLASAAKPLSCAGLDQAPIAAAGTTNRLESGSSPGMTGMAADAPSGAALSAAPLSP